MSILGNQSLMWKHNGEFDEDIEVIVKLSEDGAFQVVKNTADGKNITNDEDAKSSKVQSDEPSKEDSTTAEVTTSSPAVEHANTTSETSLSNSSDTHTAADAAEPIGSNTSGLR